ncbi:MAG: Re/Si-specific NAD(P)(+) transhydrogenase subunit alpha [Bacteroidetes bacterium]|nr:Re/Si-specific NAD(P)(+) transhydrogenase subunit alpha [Bacteroidota bacterium]
MTTIFIPTETVPGETRCAAVPETVAKLMALGLDVSVQTGAGTAASITDAAFSDAGATIVKTAKAGFDKADVIFKVRPPQGAEIKLIKKSSMIMSMFEGYADAKRNKAIAATGATVFGLEFIPRISRAQSMDVLSSQSNLAGYRAVIESTYHFSRAFPMMMTAAGTIPPARVLVMGVGVAGLQAVATAKRLGAIVSATDVRPAAKEQVESLGGKFVAVEDDEFKQAETAGGYAKQMSAEYIAKQQALITETIKSMDIVITTALIPGRPAPELVSADMVKSMKTGAVIIDMAVEQGGNCALSKADEIIDVDGVTIVGHSNMPGRLPKDASSLFSRNLLSFIGLIWDKEAGALTINEEDEIIAGSMVAKDGKLVHESLAGK